MCILVMVALMVLMVLHVKFCNTTVGWIEGTGGKGSNKREHKRSTNWLLVRLWIYGGAAYKLSRTPTS